MKTFKRDKDESAVNRKKEINIQTPRKKETTEKKITEMVEETPAAGEMAGHKNKRVRIKSNKPNLDECKFSTTGSSFVAAELYPFRVFGIFLSDQCSRSTPPALRCVLFDSFYNLTSPFYEPFTGVS